MAPAADAAYDPAYSLRLSESRPASAPAMTSTLTQRSGESANRRIAVRFPPQFGFNPGFTVTGCTAAQEQANACPESSRIGSERVVSMLGEFSGPAYLSEDFRLLVYLRGVGGAVRQKFEGKLYLQPDGGVEIVFDDLPNVSATLAEIAVDGGRRGLVLTPFDCGRYSVTRDLHEPLGCHRQACGACRDRRLRGGAGDHAAASQTKALPAADPAELEPLGGGPPHDGQRAASCPRRVERAQAVARPPPARGRTR